MNEPWIGVGLNVIKYSETELAWAAGFFDGEGSIFLNHQNILRKDRTGNPIYKVRSPAISVSQVEYAPLERFSKVVGGRKPSGPYKHKNENHSAYYKWDAMGRYSVCRILTLLWPYLSEPKKRKAKAVWAELESLKKPKSSSIPLLPKENIAVDLDGTLAEYDKWRGIEHIGKPVPLMMERVQAWIENGHKVKIFTARVCEKGAIEYIKQWLKENNLPDLEVTNIKDFDMVMLYDDRCIPVETNTGKIKVIK